jgi:hypothetical protein
MEVTKKKREDEGWECRNGLARPRPMPNSTPKVVVPIQASSVKEPFDSPDWMFEGKLDGYRAVAVNLTQSARIFRYSDLVSTDLWFCFRVSRQGQMKLSYPKTTPRA